MTQTVSNLIVEALRFINVVKYDASVNEFLIQAAVPVINDILIEWGIDPGKIPYISTIDLPLIGEKASYTFGNSDLFDVNTSPIVDIITLKISDTTFGSVIYHPVKINEYYFANLNFNAISGVPGYYILRNFEDYAEVIFYPRPANAGLTANLVVKQRISEISSASLDLTVIPLRMRTALKYELCLRASSIWGMELSESKKMQLKESVKNLTAINMAETDLSVRKDETFANYWGQYNGYWGVL